MASSTQGRASAPTIVMSNAIVRAPTSASVRGETANPPCFDVPASGASLLQVCQVCLQLLHTEPLRGLLFSVQVIAAEDGISLLAVRFPEGPGHDLQRSP